jgi:hypothetical protein
LIYPEDIFISSLKFNDSFLKSKLGFTVYGEYIQDLLVTRFSLNRGSRQEFVTSIKKDFMDDNLAKLGSIQNLAEVRK